MKKESEEEQRRLASTTPGDGPESSTGKGRGLRLPNWFNIKGGFGGGAGGRGGEGSGKEGSAVDWLHLQAQVDSRLEKVSKEMALQRSRSSRFGLLGRLRNPIGKFGRL